MSRSEMMSRIGHKDTRPEIIVRSGLHRRGYRFSLHSRKLPGRPDLVLPRHRTAIMVHGCFWHAHEGCPYFRIPGTRADFWTGKLMRNRTRDGEVRNALANAGWRVLTIWECAVRTLPADRLIDCIILWLKSEERTGQISTVSPGN